MRSSPTKDYSLRFVACVLVILVLLAGTYHLKVSRTHAKRRVSEERHNHFQDHVKTLQFILKISNNHKEK